MKRTNFNLSHQKKFTGDMGYLIPITWYEAIPGDIIRQSTTALIRMSPLVTPVMHKVFVRIHHFFVPNRIIWDDWEDFITGGPDGQDATEHPFVTVSSHGGGSLHDYFGIPVGTISPSLKVNALPYRAYQMIYNEYYRDQDLVPEVQISHGNGTDTYTSTTLKKVAWPKDYFTTCRPFEQKGNEVVIPLSGSAPIVGIGCLNGTGGTSNNVYDSANVAIQNYPSSSLLSNATWVGRKNTSTGYPDISASLSQATGIPINDLRLALALQRDMEKKAQFGSRYSEVLSYEFGIKNQDSRLQKPEYLGGGKSVIQFSEVLSTDGANTGEMYGHGISAMKTNSYRRFIPEHGIVMTLMSVIPEPLYTEGINRSFLRETKEDYFDKSLQYIGEQEVHNIEIQLDHTSRNGLFGFQKRYEEYKYIPNSIAGEMRSILDTWHYGRSFTSDVALNQSFTDCTPTKRPQASSTMHSMICNVFHNIIAKRQIANNPMPKTF